MHLCSLISTKIHCLLYLIGIRNSSLRLTTTGKEWERGRKTTSKKKKNENNYFNFNCSNGYFSFCTVFLLLLLFLVFCVSRYTYCIYKIIFKCGKSFQIANQIAFENDYMMCKMVWMKTMETVKNENEEREREEKSVLNVFANWGQCIKRVSSFN